jgi:hypothetical protein
VTGSSAPIFDDGTSPSLGLLERAPVGPTNASIHHHRRAVRASRAAGPSKAEPRRRNYEVGARLGSNNKRVIMRP